MPAHLQAYYVQVSSVSCMFPDKTLKTYSKTRATRYAEKLRGQGYPATVVPMRDMMQRTSVRG
jgi:hypothetical protein